MCVPIPGKTVTLTVTLMELEGGFCGNKNDNQLTNSPLWANIYKAAGMSQVPNRSLESGAFPKLCSYLKWKDVIKLEREKPICLKP